MKKILLSILFLSNFFLVDGQNLIGNSIYGSYYNSESGRSVGLSSDGNFVAIGAPQSSFNGMSNAGSVKVYQYKNDSTDWTQVGQDILGEAAGDLSGSSLSISNDGQTVAIGSPYSSIVRENGGQVRVFIYDSFTSDWVQKGNSIFGDNLLGYSISLSSDGNTLAFGSLKNNSSTAENTGTIYVFRYFNGSWRQLGSNINGINSDDEFAFDVSLSASGNRVATSSIEVNNRSGSVRAYEFDANLNSWIKIGQDLIGDDSNDKFGSSISFSADGNILAIGAPENDVRGSNSGKVKVYTYDDNTKLFTQTGSDILGENVGDFFGGSISLNDSGTILAIGNSTINDVFSNDNSKVKIYQYITDSWVKKGIDTTGETPSDYHGTSVSISGNGNRVATGAPRNDANGFNSGQVRVYDYSTVLNTSQFVINESIVYPNPSKGLFVIKFDKNLGSSNTIKVFNSLGILVIEKKNVTQTAYNLDLRNKPFGIYFLSIIKKGFSSKNLKIVKN